MYSHTASYPTVLTPLVILLLRMSIKIVLFLSRIVKLYSKPLLPSRQGITLPQASAMGGVNSHGPSPLGRPSPCRSGISPIDRWVPGCCNRGKYYFFPITRHPLGSLEHPSHQIILGGCSLVGNFFPSASGAPTFIFNCIFYLYILFILHNHYFIGAFEKRGN